MLKLFIYLISLKPAAIKLRALLWSVHNQDFPKDAFPPDGRVSIKILPNVKKEFYRALGFVPLGNLALRADIAERLSALIRIEARNGQFRINEPCYLLQVQQKFKWKKFFMI